jgi:heat shock protein HtpX
MSTGNTLKTVVLLVTLTAILAWVGNLFGGSTGVLIALIVALFMNGLAYWSSDRIALAMTRAHPVTREEAPILYRMVEDLAGRADVPVPRIYVISEASPNAFATGRNPSHAAVAVTRGITELLTPEELRGVLAHEFAHIKNRDILLSSIAATIAGAITGLAQMFQFAAIFDHHDDEESGVAPI